MEQNRLRIGGIPALLWGSAGDRIILAAHGSHASKTDDCIRILAEEASERGFQVLSFDLPGHGERVHESGFLMPAECVRELMRMYEYANEHARSISLFGCSMGAYFQLLTFAHAEIERVWFLSPVTDMERIIHNLMEHCHLTEEAFREKVLVENEIEPLYYPYYEYVRSHPITAWPHRTHILRGEGDTLCEYERVQQFCDRFDCELTEQKGGEHWFHTQPELDYYRQWLRERLG